MKIGRIRFLPSSFAPCSYFITLWLGGLGDYSTSRRCRIMSSAGGCAPIDIIALHVGAPSIRLEDLEFLFSVLIMLWCRVTRELNRNLGSLPGILK